MNAAVEAFHDKQYQLLVDIWALEGRECPERHILNRQYDETICGLLAELGEDAPAASIDLDQYEVFSNLHKDATGVRPNGTTYRQMVEWMDRRKQ